MAIPARVDLGSHPAAPASPARWRLLVMLVLALGGLSTSLPAAYAVALWGLLFLSLIPVLYHWMPRPFGPVFVYDLVRTARKGQAFAHRFLYGCLVFAVLLMVFAVWAPGDFLSTRTWADVPISRREMPRFALSIFVSFLATQFAGVLLITPAYVAGAIAQERERRTLEFLLVTDLTDREIVLGLLAARLANLFLLILTGLPVFALLQLLGGVDPAFIVAGFVATLMTMLSVGSLSILVSVHSRRPLSAVLLTYTWVVFGLVATACLPGVNYGNPFVSFVVLGRAGDEYVVTLMLIVLAYVGGHGLATVISCKWAVKSLRDAYRDTDSDPMPTPVLPVLPVRPAVAVDGSAGPQRRPESEVTVGGLIPWRESPRPAAGAPPGTPTGPRCAGTACLRDMT
jgi:hypothetical protein